MFIVILYSQYINFYLLINLYIFNFNNFINNNNKMIKDSLELTEEEYKEINRIDDPTLRVNATNLKKVKYFNYNIILSNNREKKSY